MQQEYRGYAKKGARTVLELLHEEAMMRPSDVPSILMEECAVDPDKIREVHKGLMAVPNATNEIVSTLIFDVAQLGVK